MSAGGVCELCGRQVSLLTKHHLIPKTRHGNKRVKRDFERHEVKYLLAWFCRPCHNHVHAMFTEKTLEREFNTVKQLAANFEIAKFVKWIRNNRTASSLLIKLPTAKGHTENHIHANGDGKVRSPLKSESARGLAHSKTLARIRCSAPLQ